MSSNKADFNFYLNTQGPRGPRGVKGDQGFSPNISVAESGLNTFKLRITNEGGSFDTPNLRGSIIDDADTSGVLSYDKDSDTIFVTSLPRATSVDEGVVRYATEVEVLSNAENVAVSPSDLQDYLANKLVASDNSISVTKDENTGTVSFNVPSATYTSDGIVKPDGATIGFLPNSSTLACYKATNDKFGIVKPDGETIRVDSSNGLLYAQLALPWQAGVVIPDMVTIKVNNLGVISAPISRDNTLGIVRPDGVTCSTDGNGFLSVAAGGVQVTDPIDIVDGKVALKVDGQLVTVNPQGELTVNLDEVGEEMMELQSQINTLNETIAALTSRIASLEAEIDGGEVQ